jgi:response regulator RpfG family c-di-GMP phosphodiesterase
MTDVVRILCVDDERNVLRALERIFLEDDYEILTATSGEEGLRLLNETADIQLVLSDYRMPGMNGVQFLRQVYERCPDTVRIVLSGYADTASVVEAINEGQIYKFIPKPWNDDELRITVSKAIESFALQRQNRELTEELRDKNEELRQMNDNLERLVTERSAELVLQNRALLHTRYVLQSIPVGVIGILPDGVISLLNHEAAAQLKKSVNELLGEKARDVLPGELCDLSDEISSAGKACRLLQLHGSMLQAKGLHLVKDGQEAIVMVLDRQNCEMG